MATLVEHFGGRVENLGIDAEVRYTVFDAADEAAVAVAAAAQVPSTITSNGVALYRKSLRIDEQLAATAWRLTARYEKNPWVLTPSKFSFETAGGTQHITQSKATVNSYGPLKSAKLKGAIGFDGKTVKGCEIVVPKYEWSETHYLDVATVNDAYKLAVANLTGKVNDDTFRGFAAGEVLFLGASGSWTGQSINDPWEVVFRFAREPNATGLEVGDISGIAKGGWHYLWVYYADEADEAIGMNVKTPGAVYVERVYDSGDFSTLGI
jgi:hypothetical protein